MTAYLQRIVFDASVTGSFRALVSASESAFSQMGWVNMNVSGTVDWTTVIPPNATNQYRGYSVWRFNDSFQSTAPVFIKVEYGSTTGATNRIAYRVQAARQADTSGTIYDSLSSQIIGGLTFGSTASGTIGFSGTPGRGLVVVAYGSAAPTVWGIERGTTLSGSVDPDQLYLWVMGQATATSDSTALYSYATGSLRASLIPASAAGYVPFFFVDDAITGLTSDTIVSLDSAPSALMNFNIKNKGLPLSMMAAKRFTADTVGDILSVSPYGYPITYLNLGSGFAVQSLGSGEFSLFVRWE